MPAPRRGLRRTAGLISVLLVIAAMVLPLQALAVTGDSLGQRHPPPGSIPVQVSVVPPEVVAETILESARSLASNARLMVERGNYEVMYSGGVNFTGEPYAVELHVSGVPGDVGLYEVVVSGGIPAYLDVERTLLDAAWAVLHRDYREYESSTMAAMQLYNETLSALEWIKGKPFVYAPLANVTIEASGRCRVALLIAVEWLENGGEEPTVETAASILQSASREGECYYRALLVHRVWIPSSYVESYLSLTLYSLSLILNLRPLSSDMKEFVFAQMTLSQAGQGEGGIEGSQGENMEEQASVSTSSPIPLNASGLSGLRGSAGSVAPAPRELQRILEKLASHSNASSGAVDLGAALKGISSASGGLPHLLGSLHALGIPRSIAGREASGILPGVGRFLSLLTATGLLVVMLLALYKANAYSALTRSIRRLYAHVIAGIARISLRGDALTPALRCYLYALRISSRLAGAKSPSETPREYLARAQNELPYRIRLLLEHATKAYEEYRYAHRSPRLPDVCPVEGERSLDLD